MASNAELIISSANQVTTPLYALLGGKPRIVNFTSANDAWDYDSFELTGKGVALNDISSTSIYIADTEINRDPISKDGTKIAYRVSSSDWSHVEISKDKVTRIPVKAKVTFCKKVMFFFCRNTINTYNTEIILFPEIIGNVITHYTHMNEIISKNQKCSQVVESDRAQTEIDWTGFERGEKSITVSLSPDEGYRFITDSNSPEKPTYSFKLSLIHI